MNVARRKAYRDDAARLGLALWTVAFVALPGLHLVGHRSDHHHLPGGGVAWDLDAHHHTGAHHHVDDHHHTSAPTTTPQADAGNLPRHGDNDSAHLAKLLLSADPPPNAVFSVPLVAPLWLWPTVEVAVGEPFVPTLPRGPPA